ncbi:hypothetical protein GGS20DRAFT_571673 [Poronia punctata]|nr:hypothetical protein GGS20DRAFT_571673 [Poronia punctata]
MATTAAGRTVWNDKTRSDLLMEIIDVAPPSTQQWDEIIEHLHAKGYSYTYNAALQHLQKLKRKEGAPAGEGSVPATPKKTGKNGDAKPKTPRTPKTPKTPGGRKRKAPAASTDDAEEEEILVKEEKKLKIEHDEDHDSNDEGLA